MIRWKLKNRSALLWNYRRTGHLTHSARVVFISGEERWYDTGRLELVDESR